MVSLFHLHQARFFFQQLISGVSYCHSMVLSLMLLHWVSKPFYPSFCFIFCVWFKAIMSCSKFVIEISSLKIHSWTAVQHHVLKSVILGTQRYSHLWAPKELHQAIRIDELITNNVIIQICSHLCSILNQSLL